ncbi:HAD hydrolase family protein [Enterococcus sp. HY326]|uniref:HAD hydrolase family protein n=1 Tax=Enterococcus sp. HY326 TaxID=2971265 RepID=UPI00223EF66A|nr:HAD hydrolase family protein [Enterococcus sp. HY326]
MIEFPLRLKKRCCDYKNNKFETVIATGRSYSFIKDLAARLKIGSVIASNGAQVTHHGRTIQQHALAPQLAQQVIKELEKRQIDYLIETTEAIFYPPGADFRGDSQLNPQPLTSKDQLPPNILQFICQQTDNQPLSLTNPAVIGEKVAPTIANIHAENVSKASGISALLHQLKLTPDEAIAFGDEENDLKMFEAVGLPIAMGNATAQLKERARLVTADVGDDGIWKAYLQLGLIQD